jgi:hypothetical protein
MQLQSLLKTERCTLKLDAIGDDKVRVTCLSWDDAKDHSSRVPRQSWLPSHDAGQRIAPISKSCKTCITRAPRSDSVMASDAEVVRCAAPWPGSVTGGSTKSLLIHSKGDRGLLDGCLDTSTTSSRQARLVQAIAASGSEKVRCRVSIDPNSEAARCQPLSPTTPPRLTALMRITRATRNKAILS